MLAGTAAFEGFAAAHDVARVAAPAAVPAMAGFVADDGEPIRVWRLGAGRPVILLHGLTCSHRDWAEAARLLAPSHEVFAWEARSHGPLARRGTDEPGIARMARDLEILLGHFGLRDAVVVGHSMGAAVALEHLRRYGSARVAALCLVDHSPRLVASRGWRFGVPGAAFLARSLRLAAALGAEAGGLALRALAVACKDVPEEPRAAAAERDACARRNMRSLARILETVLAADHREVLARIDVPVLGVFGGASPLYARVPLTRYYAAAIADFRGLTYPGAGHSPHREAPARFAADLAAFIAGAVAERRARRVAA